MSESIDVRDDNYYIILIWNYDLVHEGIKKFKGKNYQEAVSLFRPYAEKDDPIAQYWMGYTNQMIGETNEALKWHISSARLGFAFSAQRASEIYHYGLRDYFEAEKWAKIVASLGFTKSMQRFGLAYATGMGAIKDKDVVAIICGGVGTRV